MSRASWCWVAGVLLVVGLVYASLGSWLVRTDALQPADVVIALGGEPDACPRAQRALALQRDALAPSLVVSVPRQAAYWYCPDLAQYVIQRSQNRELPPSAFIAIDDADNTFDEALAVRALAARYDWRTLIVVTTAYHTRRAGRTFRSVMPGVRIVLEAVPEPLPRLLRPSSLADAALSAPVEFGKNLFYWVRHGVAPF